MHLVRSRRGSQIPEELNSNVSHPMCKLWLFRKARDMPDGWGRKGCQSEGEADEGCDQAVGQSASAVRGGVVRVGVICITLGFVLGAGVAYAWQQGKFNVSTPAEDNTTAPVILERIVKQNELVSASQKYESVRKAANSKKFFDLVDIPFTENSYWYCYVGTIKAAVDLSKATFVGQEGDVITVSLEEPYISSNTPDMEKSGVLEEHNNVLNPITVKDMDAFRKQCVKEAEKAATTEGELFEEAKENARTNLSSLFSIALDGEYEVKVEWREAE